MNRVSGAVDCTHNKRVPIRNAHPSPEPEIGDVIEIEYAGEILETYPAQIADVYGIKVIEKNKGFTHLANDD